MKLFAILSFLSSLAVHSTANPSGVKVAGVTYGGTGCNQGTLSINVDDDGSICPIRTRNLVAQDGANVPVADSRRFCQMNFDLVYPQGWSFSVLGVDYTGYVAMAGSTTGHVQSTYYFSGQTDQAVSRVDFTGPIYGKFERHDDLVWETWSPCGNTEAMLNVVQEVVVSGTGRIASTSTDGEFVNAVILKWKEC